MRRSTMVLPIARLSCRPAKPQVWNMGATTVTSLYKKAIHGRPYWYLREMGWVQGKPKMVSERYVGTVADVEALLDAREHAMVPQRSRHLDFGAVAAVWGC